MATVADGLGTLEKMREQLLVARRTALLAVRQFKAVRNVVIEAVGSESRTSSQLDTEIENIKNLGLGCEDISNGLDEITAAIVDIKGL